MKKYKLATLGCRTNQYESEAFATQLRALGYTEAAGEERADICIVNTCTITEEADRSSRHQIRQLARRHAGSTLLVTGCLADRAPKELEQISGVTHVVKNRHKEALLTHLFPEEALPEFAIDTFAGHTRAFVKVQDGCDSFCTYCIVPYVRGRSRSRTIAEVVAEVQGLVQNGYKEVVLTGINIGDFDGGEGKPHRLPDLVRAVDQIDGLKRLRLSSIDPTQVDAPLQEALLAGKRTCPSLHLVLQSGSNVILKRMNRTYTRQQFTDTVARLKAASPDFTFTTDIIVGFPGETEDDFEETLEMMRQVLFAKVHMFPYSARKRTRAALYPNQLPQEVIEERKQRVLRLAEEMAFALRQPYVGRRLEVLLESEETEGFSAHSANFLRILVRGENLQSNKLVQVRCTENRPEGLVAYAD
jgi:threonylcarbamoyladenosine tRNA methylthiotransferase MtaB